MLETALVASAFGVAMVYFVIAAVVVPKIGLGSASPRFVGIVRAGATLFFVGCGLTHLHIAVHTFGTQGSLHELGFHMLQLVGGWAFVFAALRYLNIRIEPRELETQLRRMDELQVQTMHDPLTGAYNRRWYEDALMKELSRAHRRGEPVSVAHLDVDDFKAVNDSAGHAQGDEVLRAVALAARKALRPSDSVVRLGGDEFVLLLPGAGGHDALAAAERVRAELHELALAGPDGVAVSVGVASCPDDGATPSELDRAADDALYRVKRTGKDGAARAGDFLELALETVV